GAARTFVSAAGSDSNNCANVTTPCRHLAAAFAATAPDGEIYVLDPANYGSLTITHGVSIEGHGWASIAPVANGNAITVNANPGDKINIIGVVLDGTALAGTRGIAFNSGGSLTVADCVVRNMADGLDFRSSVTTPQTLAVSNSYFNDNNLDGIFIEPQSSGPITASIDRSVFSGNGGEGLLAFGAAGTGALNVAVTNSVAVNNGDEGFSVSSNMSHSVSNLSLTHSLAEGNGNGVVAVGINAAVWLAQSTVTGNTFGFVIGTGGVINTYVDNYFAAMGAIPEA
ncbi:MAG TPA: right-handed parallel beta-helix repeat-containing protein, partial [Pseudolabrys sp.]|nr:right-handed parallel beta-helix repeat-containing protein [Pseudolabrys sp.]